MTGVDVFGRARVPLPTAAQAADADRAAHQAGIPSRVLMENAGRAAALVLHRQYPRGRIVGIAGSGNNGGDLLVMLRVLRAWGREVHVIAAGSAPPDAALLHGARIDITDADADEARFALGSADVVVDGMLGTGAAGPPRGRIRDWIGYINATPRPVCALDVPTGVDATSGAVHDAAIHADLTITFGWPKLGLLLHPARQHCGRLVAVEIGFPPGVEGDDVALAITPDLVRDRLRSRPPDAHKGSEGRLLVLAGSTGMAGAAALTAGAALCAGAGLLRIASPAANREILQTLVPEATFLDAATLGPDDVDSMHGLVAGPGLGTDATARSTLHRVLDMTAGRPTLLDADALNILAALDDAAAALRAIAGGRELVITPHAKELSRLTGATVDAILADAPGAGRAAAAAFDCVVLLKGQPSLVATPDGALLVNTVGSSDAATAGMGDQLAGTVGALLVGGASALDAAALGLFLSSRAADLAALGRALSPRDVSEQMHRAFEDPGPTGPPDELPFVTFDQPPRR